MRMERGKRFEEFFTRVLAVKTKIQNLAKKELRNSTLKNLFSLSFFLLLFTCEFALADLKEASNVSNASAKPQVKQKDLLRVLDFLQQTESQAIHENNLVNRVWTKIDLAKIPLAEPGYTLVPELDKESTMVVRIDIDPNFLQDPVTLSTMKHQISEFTQQAIGYRTFFQDHRQWAETYWNAQAGDPEAKLELKRHELHSLKKAEEGWTSKTEVLKITHDRKVVEETFKKRKKLLEKEVAILQKEANAKKKLAEANWKHGEGKRQSFETAKEKLDDLLKKNDRKGVSQLIRAYLPWDAMAPIEKTAWTQWLEAIENPRTDEKGSTVLFRGLDTADRTFTGVDGNPALMSTMLTKNQGNYTRRLRSYRAKRTTFGSTTGAASVLFGEKYEGKYTSLTGMMAFHASDPLGTPFISFSDFSVAKGFAQNGIMTVRIDNRRILPNSAGPLPNELERLVPLVIFPDEVVHYKEVPAYDPDLGLQAAVLEREEAFKKYQMELEEKLGRKLSPAETENLNKAGWAFRDEGFRIFVDQYVKPLQPAVNVPEGVTYIPLAVAERKAKLLNDCEGFFSVVGKK